MVKAVRPGGRVALSDDDHDVLRLWPEPPGLGAVWHAYVRSYDRLGNDPFIGRRLVALLHAAGARPVRNNWIFFGASAGSAEFAVLVANLDGILAGARATVLGLDLIGADAYDAGLASLRAWGTRRDAAFWYAVCFAEGVRP
jgi:hypothetical protein